MPRYQREKFSNDELKNFVSLVRRHECIYNPYHEDHKDYGKTKQSWEAIAAICGREGYTGEACKNKFYLIFKNVFNCYLLIMLIQYSQTLLSDRLDTATTALSTTMPGGRFHLSFLFGLLTHFLMCSAEISSL